MQAPPYLKTDPRICRVGVGVPQGPVRAQARATQIYKQLFFPPLIHNRFSWFIADTLTGIWEAIMWGDRVS